MTAPRQLVRRRLWWLVPVVLSWYLVTLAPSLTWADGARLQLDVRLGGSTYWYFDELRAVPTDGWPFERLGVAAWDHPLYVMAAQSIRLMPWGEPLWRINALSALAAAAAVGLAAHVMYQLTGDATATSLAALALAVSHTFWFHAVTAEVYALHALLLLLLILLVVRMRAQPVAPALVMVVAGLALSNHVMAVLCFVPLWWTARSRLVKTRAAVVSMLLAFVAAWSPWWVQALRMARVAGVAATVEVALAAPWLSRRVTLLPGPELAVNLLQYGAWLLYQFTPLGLGLAIYGLGWLWQRDRTAAQLVISLWAIHALFSANYRVADRFAFHLPSYIMVALLIAAGVAGLRQRGGMLGRHRGTMLLALGLIGLPVMLYRATPSLLNRLGIDETALGITPIGTGARDTLRYFLDPNKRGDDSALRFARSALAQLPPGAVVVTPWPADQETYVVLRYAQLVEHQRPDVRLDLVLAPTDLRLSERLKQRIAAELACRPVFLASLNADYPLADLQASYAITPAAELFQLTPRRGTAPARCTFPPPPAMSIEALIRSTSR